MSVILRRTYGTVITSKIINDLHKNSWSQQKSLKSQKFNIFFFNFEQDPWAQ